ncbi:hypothetical protein P7C73_g2517, partial [Tremellales sp. Uapishka_1]
MEQGLHELPSPPPKRRRYHSSQPPNLFLLSSQKQRPKKIKSVDRLGWERGVERELHSPAESSGKFDSGILYIVLGRGDIAFRRTLSRSIFGRHELRPQRQDLLTSLHSHTAHFYASNSLLFEPYKQIRYRPYSSKKRALLETHGLRASSLAGGETRSAYRERESSEPERREEKSTVGRYKKRDMLEAFDGSALLALGILVQERIIQSLRDAGYVPPSTQEVENDDEDDDENGHNQDDENEQDDGSEKAQEDDGGESSDPTPSEDDSDNSKGEADFDEFG